MSGSLPEMGDWDAIFDETYLTTYLPFLDEERTRTEALGAVALAEVEPGDEILDCPVGIARHAIVLTEAGYRVTGLDRSPTQLAEAERRRGEAEWPRLARGDYRQLPFEDEAFDAVLCLFTSLGYLGPSGDLDVLLEFRRVLRSGGALVLETPAPRRTRPVCTPPWHAQLGTAPGRVTVPPGAGGGLGGGHDVEPPSRRHPGGRASRAAVRPPRLLGAGVGRAAPGGRISEDRDVRELGRSLPRHAGELACDRPRPLSAMH